MAPTAKLLAEWFWVDRWMGSSAFLLPLEARGLYREMLSQAWRRGAQLPNDHEAIRRAIGATEKEWRRCWPAIAPYWRQEGESLVNDTQLEVYREAIEKQSERGAKAQAAARARWKKPTHASAHGDAQASAQASTQASAQASTQAVPQQCPPSPSPVHPSVPLKEIRESGSPQRAPRPGSLTAKGEALRFDEAQRRLHEKCHREVCAYWTTPPVRVCMSGTQVLQFASKLVGVPTDQAVRQVLAWAQAHVPTVAELPSKPWAYWDTQWDARASATAGDARFSPSGVPTVEETQAMLRRLEEQART